MRCLEDTDLYKTAGNYDSAEADNLQAVFEECDPVKNANSTDEATRNIQCASEAQIKDYMEGRYILAVHQQKKFVSHKFEEKSFVQNAEI